MFLQESKAIIFTYIRKYVPPNIQAFHALLHYVMCMLLVIYIYAIYFYYNVGFGDIDTSLLPPPNFTFINNSMTAPGNFFIMDDDALECDEIAYATFDFSNDATALYSTARMEPLITYLIIRDNDRKYIFKIQFHNNRIRISSIFGKSSFNFWSV